MLRKVLLILSALFIFAACGDAVVDPHTSDKNLVVEITPSSLTKAITTDTFAVSSMDVKIEKNDSGAEIANFTWQAVESQKKVAVKINEAGDYTITATHHGSNADGSITVTETNTFSIKPFFITTIKIIPGQIGVMNVFEENNGSGTTTTTTNTTPADPGELYTGGRIKISLKAWHGKYVAAEDSDHGAGQVNANRTAIGPYEIWTLIPLGDGSYAIQAWTGKYMVAEDADHGNGIIHADRSAIGPYEKWKIFKTPEGKYIIRAWNNQYLAAEDSDHGYPAINANRPAVGPYENWTIIFHKEMTIKAWHGKYVAAEDSDHGYPAVNANRTLVGPYEKWTLVDLDDGTHAIQAWHGKFLSAMDSGTPGLVQAGSSTVGSMQKWTLAELSPGIYSIKAANNFFLAAEDTDHGYPAIHANRSSVGPYENWTINF